MFKKSPKNCFKPVLSSSSLSCLTDTTHEPVENNNKTQQSGPVLSYFNYFSLPQVDIVGDPSTDYIPLNLSIEHNSKHCVYISSSIY